MNNCIGLRVLFCCMFNVCAFIWINVFNGFGSHCRRSRLPTSYTTWNSRQKNRIREEKEPNQFENHILFGVAHEVFFVKRQTTLNHDSLSLRQKKRKTLFNINFFRGSNFFCRPQLLFSLTLSGPSYQIQVLRLFVHNTCFVCTRSTFDFWSFGMQTKSCKWRRSFNVANDMNTLS